MAAAAVTFFAVAQASAEDAKTTKTANALLTDSGSYIPPKTAPQPTPVVTKPTPKAAPKAAAPKAHAPKKAKPNAPVKAKAPKQPSSARKV